MLQYCVDKHRMMFWLFNRFVYILLLHLPNLVLKTPETLISQKAPHVTSTFVVSYTKNFFDFQDIIFQKKLCLQMGDLLQLGLNYDYNDLFDAFDVFEFKTNLIFFKSKLLL